MEEQGRIGPIEAVVVDVNDMERAARFWAAVLGAHPSELNPRYLRLEIPEGPPHVLLQLVPEYKTVKARLHLDIGVPDLDAGVQQVEALGGRKLQPMMEENGGHFIVMVDTEENEFCLVLRRS